MKLVFLFLVGLALGAVAPAGGHAVRLQRRNCPPFWFSFNGRCYKYVATRMTWADAELYCLSQKGNLVSIHGLKEQKFVKSLINNFDHREGYAWIGLSDIHKEGGWMWSDGCPAKFIFWNAHEPNNAGNEDCVHTSHPRKWNDKSCSDHFPSVCATRIRCL